MWLSTYINMRDFTCSVSREHFIGLSNLTSNQ